MLTLDLFSGSFFNGSSSSTQVPKVFNVSLNGRNYMIDFSQPFYRQYRRQIAPLLRSQADVGTEPGEQSINPEDLWRRSQDDWSLGAGQTYLDRKDSLPNRFRSSKGINIWDKWQLSLLPDTTHMYSSTTPALSIVTAGQYLYIADGPTLSYTTDGLTFTTVLDTPADDISSITTDGFNVWFACNNSGVWTTTIGLATCSQLVSSALSQSAIVSFLKGRLMVASDSAIYNITSNVLAALPVPLFVHSNADWAWIGFANGQSQIYIAGFSGGTSAIYGITILTDGTALQPPIQQGELPPGEIATSIHGSTGFLFIGTNLGIRFAASGGSGDITIEALIPTSNPVLAITSFNRFVYFSWSDYDSTSTGIGRLDIQNFAISNVQPAYASDLMVTGQGAVNSMTIFDNEVVFGVGQLGLYTPSTTALVDSGTLDSGWILYDLPDIKIALQLLVQSPVPLPAGSYSSSISADDNPFVEVGSHLTTDPDPVRFSVPQLSAQRFEVRTTLTSDLTMVSPTISRYTLRAWPAPRRPLTWQVPVILNESIINTSGSTDGFDPLTELQALESMANSGSLVSYQEGDQSYPVIVTDVQFLPDYLTEDRHYFNGVAILQLKGVPK